MIGFLQPWLLAALPLAALPLLLHLVARREPPTVSFPAVRYLQEATREHQRRLRLRNLLLLIARTLLVLALVLAAAGPTLPAGSPGEHAPTALEAPGRRRRREDRHPHRLRAWRDTQVSQRLIPHLRPVDLTVLDDDKQVEFYKNTWGLTRTETDSSPAPPVR